MKAERDRQYEENVGLIARNAFLESHANRLEVEIDHVERQLQNVNRSQETLQKDRDYWRDLFLVMRPQVQFPSEPWQQSPEAFRNQQLQADAQLQWSQAQQANQQQLAQNAQNQFSWHDCTCIPGRSAAFGILRTRDSDD